MTRKSPSWMLALGVALAVVAVTLALVTEPEASLVALSVGIPVSLGVRRQQVQRMGQVGERDITPDQLPRWLREEISLHWNDDQRLIERRVRGADGRRQTEWTWIDEDGDVINTFGPRH